MSRFDNVKDVRKICAITGARREDFPEGLETEALRAGIERVLRAFIFRKYTVFQTDMRRGVPLYAAESVLRLRREYPHIRLRCLLPCETQANNWPESWRERYFDVLAQADEVVLLHTRYAPGCYQSCARALLDRAQGLLAAYHGEQLRSGRAYPLRRAAAGGLETMLLSLQEYTGGAAGAAGAAGAPLLARRYGSAGNYR